MPIKIPDFLLPGQIRVSIYSAYKGLNVNIFKQAEYCKVYSGNNLKGFDELAERGIHFVLFLGKHLISSFIPIIV